MKNKLSNVEAFPSSKEQRMVRYELLENEFVVQDADRICETCGNDHSFRPDFEGVKTSIDVIPELIQRLLEMEVFA